MADKASTRPRMTGSARRLSSAVEPDRKLTPVPPMRTPAATAIGSVGDNATAVIAAPKATAARARKAGVTERRRATVSAPITEPTLMVENMIE
jgi:hypothetical protein